MPVSALKYLIVGHPPAPGLWSPRTWSVERLMSPNETSGLVANASVALFHAGACLVHQPQPSDAIQRTNMVFPAAISAATVDSKLSTVSFVERVQWPSG